MSRVCSISASRRMFTADIRSAVRDFEPQLIGLTVRNTDECYMSGAFFLPFVKEVVRLRPQAFRRADCDGRGGVLGDA